MNKRTIRNLFILLITAGITLMTAACKRETLEEPSVSQTVQATQPAETQPAATETMPTEPAETQPQEEHFLLTFAGDCTLGSNPNNYYAGFGFIKTVGEDYDYPFSNVIGYFENDDFTMVNLEGALCDSGYAAEKKHVFRGPTSYVNILTQNSVEAVTLANNHTLDYGQSGYDSTVAALQNAGIPYVERDSAAIITTESGLTIGLYGAVYYLLDEEVICREIGELKANEEIDLVIFVPHWGVEHTYHPTQQQTALAHAAIDAGADIVYGSHAHVLQPIEEYNGGIIYYSLGNFSFGGNIYPGDYDTALLQQEIIRESNGTVRLGALNIVACNVSSIEDRNNFQPTPYETGSEEYNRTISKLDGTFDGPDLPIS